MPRIVRSLQRSNKKKDLKSEYYRLRHKKKLTKREKSILNTFHNLVLIEETLIDESKHGLESNKVINLIREYVYNIWKG
jgi:hypothetical protein